MNDSFDITVRQDEDAWHDNPSTAELGLLAADCIDRLSGGASVARSNVTIGGDGYVLILVKGQLTEDVTFDVSRVDLTEAPHDVVRVDSLPTRDQIREALSTKVAPAARPRMLHVEDAVDAVMALLGQAEEATP
jgi:hypothetical protein